jgi:hypothetical protein
MADAAPMNEGPWSDDEAEQVGESRSGDDDAAPVDEDRFNDNVPHVYDTHSSEETATMDPPSPARSEQNAEATILGTDIETWLARLRPSPSELAAGAAVIGSHELKQHGRMMRYVGERSASKMLGEKMGATPGQDPSTDEAWQYLVDLARFESLASPAETLSRDAPTERKADVTRLLAELLTEQGMRYLRAFAHELWVHAGSPFATSDGEPTAVTTVNWPACWAWDCHIAAISFSEVHTVGHLLLDLVERLILQKELQMRPTICPIDLESDYHAGIGSPIWVSLHPCMHWCGSVGLNNWTQDLKQTTCPLCRTPIRFIFERIQDE